MSSIKCWHQRQYYKCIRSVSSLYRRKIDISKSPYRHNPSCLQLGESTSAAFPCGRRRILRCQDFSPLVVQSRLLSTHDDETTYIEGNAIDLIMDPNDKTEKHDSVLLPSENDSDKSKPKLVTEEEERRRYWIARIDSQTLDDVVEIRNILKDIGNGKAANRINERLERPIFLPQDGTKILSKDPPIDSSTGIYADVKDELDEDFSAWRDFIAEAETVSPFRRRRSRQKRRWKVSRGIQHSLSVLRVMSHKWWKEIDSMLEEGTSLSKLESFLEDSIPDIDVDADSTTSTNDIVELDTMEDEELTEPNSYDEINEVLNLVTKGDITFNTACFNTLLARVSVALDLSPSHCHQLILTINKAMKDTRVLPDPITSEILLRVMSQRIGSPHTAILFVRELMEDSSLRSPDSLQAAFSLCESINDANLALTLWQCYLKNDQSAYQLTFGALNFYINVLKLDFLQRQAFDVVKLALKQNQSPKNRALDSLFENVCTWQPTNRDHSQDNTRILEATLKILLKESLYRPSHVVWRTIILTASKHSQTDQRRTRIVYSALREFMERFPEFSPDGELAKIGYVALQWVGDHGLAMDIFTRRLSNVIQRIKDEGRASSEINDRLAGESTTSKTDDIDTEQRELTKHQSNRVSSDEVFVVLSICVECDAMDAVHSILSLVEEFGYAFHPSLYPQIFTLAIEAFVGHGKLQLAEEALQRCLKRGHLPSEKDFGNIIHGHFVSGSKQTAQKLFETLETGGLGVVRPGPTCFNSMILASIVDCKWEDSLSWYDRMIESGIEPLASCYAGLLLASFKIGGEERALSFIRQLSSNQARISGETIQFILKLFLPGFECDVTFVDIRKRIRHMIDMRGESREPLLDLLRSIREAELEDEKQRKLSPSNPLLPGDGWRDVLPKLVSVLESQILKE